MMLPILLICQHVVHMVLYIVHSSFIFCHFHLLQNFYVYNLPFKHIYISIKLIFHSLLTCRPVVFKVMYTEFQVLVVVVVVCLVGFSFLVFKSPVIYT